MRLQLRVAFAVGSVALFGAFSLAETSPAPSAPAETGVEGLITISPILGGPVREGVPTSAPLPNTAFVVRQADHVVAKFVTDEHGRFRVPLSPGQYEVVAEKPRQKIGRYGPWSVDVIAGEMAKVHWTCDSGMR
jgi:hypothetical protein